MGKYGSGLTFGQCCNMDKEQIRHALRGELVCGEDEHGFQYEKASRADCEAFILRTYDEAVFQAKEAMDGGRALERLMKAHGLELGKTYTLMEYGKYSKRH